MLGSFVQVTAPAVVAVSAADAKRFLHGVAEDETDADIAALVEAATKYAETWLDQQLITATWDLYLPGFPDGLIELRPPLQSVTHIKYYDTANALQTWTSTYYEVDTDHLPGRVQPGYGYVYPSTYGRMDAVEIEFKCGYGDAATDIPDNILLAVKRLVHDYYERRVSTGGGTEAVDRLLSLSGHGAYA